MNETISIFKNDLYCKMDNDMATEDVELSTTTSILNQFNPKNDKYTVSCIRFYPILKASKENNVSERAA